MEKREVLYPGKFYHIYNRGINKELIFFNNSNYVHFLNRFDYYLAKFIDVYVYRLLPNHFHFLVKVKKEDDIKNLPGFENLEGFYSSINNPISKAFSNFFNAYVKAVNKQQNRYGSLFQKNYKRKLIDKDDYLTRIIYYIHLNPVIHNITDIFENYKFSSYRSMIMNKNTRLKRKEILMLFNGKENFIRFHRSRLKEKMELEEYYLE